MEVTFVASVQGHQAERVHEMAERLRKQRPDLKVTLVEGDAAKPLLLRHKLQFGPAILIDGRVEYVGVPRWRFLLERMSQVAQGIVNPRTAAPPTPPAPATAARPAPAVPAKPAAPPTTTPSTAPPNPARAAENPKSEPVDA